MKSICSLVSHRMFPSAVSDNKAGRENRLMRNMIWFQYSFTPLGFCQNDIYSRIRSSAAKTKRFACKISECEGKSVPVVWSQSRSRAVFRQMWWSSLRKPDCVFSQFLLHKVLLKKSSLDNIKLIKRKSVLFFHKKVRRFGIFWQSVPTLGARILHSF